MLKLKDERGTLTKVAEMLESGELEHTKDKGGGGYDKPGFNLSETAISFKCGAVACIGGSAWLLEHPEDFNNARAYVMGTEGSKEGPTLYNLFFLGDGEGRMEAITPQQAAIAIRKYLAGSSTLWDHVINEEGQDDGE
jgi:hypothetical protein